MSETALKEYFNQIELLESLLVKYREELETLKNRISSLSMHGALKIPPIVAVSDICDLSDVISNLIKSNAEYKMECENDLSIDDLMCLGYHDIAIINKMELFESKFNIVDSFSYPRLYIETVEPELFAVDKSFTFLSKLALLLPIFLKMWDNILETATQLEDIEERCTEMSYYIRVVSQGMTTIVLLDLSSGFSGVYERIKSQEDKRSQRLESINDLFNNTLRRFWSQPPKKMLEKIRDYLDRFHPDILLASDLLAYLDKYRK